MSEADLDRRVGMLEERLARVEAQLGLAVEEARVAPPVVERPEDPRVRESTTDLLLHLRAAKEPAKRVVLPPPLPPMVAPEPVVEISEEVREEAPGDEGADVGVAGFPVETATPQPALSYAPAYRKAPVAQTGLEQAIGLKWAGWVGAVILIIGAGLGIKFAYDQGWFGGIPNSAKLILISLGGFALIGAGEWVYRRVNKLSAAGLFGAGVAVFFLASYAGFGFYGVYARNTAFVLMALSTLAGAAVARRGNLVSIAVLSLIGGNLAPILLHSNSPDLPAFFAYLLMLQAVALVLAYWGGEAKWWTLRGLSLASNAVWMLALMVRPRFADSQIAELNFLVLSAGFYQIELIASAWRGRHETRGELSNPGVLFSTVVTAALTAALLVVLEYSSGNARGTAVLLTGAICAAAGFLLPRNEKRGLAALRIGYRIQAAVLLVVAVPVMLSGAGIEIGWLAIAIAFAGLAWSLDLPIARYAAASTWGLAALHFGWRWGMEGFSERRLVGGVPVALLMAAAITVVGHGIAWMVGRSRNGHVRLDRLRWVPTIGGTLVFVAASVELLSPIGATFTLVLYAWILLAMDLLTDELGAAMQAVAVLGLSMFKWVFVDLLAERLSANWSPGQHAAVFNPAMGVGLLIACSLVGMFWFQREALLATLRRWGFAKADERESMLVLAGIVIGLMTIGLSFEIDRILERRAMWGGTGVWPIGQVKQLLLSMLWSAAAGGQLLLARTVEPLSEGRRTWLGRIDWMLMLLAAKFLLLDTLMYRIGSGAAQATVLFNLQTLGAVIVLAGLAAACFIAAECQMIFYRRIAGFLIVLVLLWTGASEIDRAFENLAASGSMSASHAHFAKQVAMSIFGAVFAIASVGAGFYFRSAPVRYLGLALFGLTLLKVFFVDLADAGQGYRVLSFLGLGALLLGTSVLYGKLSPKLLRD